MYKLEIPISLKKFEILIVSWKGIQMLICNLPRLCSYLCIYYQLNCLPFQIVIILQKPILQGLLHRQRVGIAGNQEMPGKPSIKTEGTYKYSTPYSYHTKQLAKSMSYLTSSQVVIFVCTGSIKPFKYHLSICLHLKSLRIKQSRQLLRTSTFQKIM